MMPSDPGATDIIVGTNTTEIQTCHTGIYIYMYVRVCGHIPMHTTHAAGLVYV